MVPVAPLTPVMTLAEMLITVIMQTLATMNSTATGKTAIKKRDEHCPPSPQAPLPVVGLLLAGGAGTRMDGSLGCRGFTIRNRFAADQRQPFHRGIQPLGRSVY